MVKCPINIDFKYFILIFGLYAVVTPQLVIAVAPTYQTTLEATLTPPSGAPANDYFGISTSISDDARVIGAPSDISFNSGSEATDAAYIFEKGNSGNWDKITTLSADPTEYDNFGEAVSISGNTVIR